MQVSPYNRVQEFINQMLYLEEMFFARTYDSGVVEQLISSYGQMVEYFDQKKDPIRSYFMEKIQFVISRPETLKVIVPKKTQAKKVIFAEEIDIQEATVQELDQMQRSRSSKDYLGRYSIRRKKQERAATVKIYMEVDQQGQDQRTDLDTLLRQFDEASQEYSQVIQKQLELQESRLKEKLKNRKNNRKRALSADKKQEIEKLDEVINEDEEENLEQPPPPKRKSIFEEIIESTNFMRMSANRLSMSLSQVQKPCHRIVNSVNLAKSNNLPTVQE